MIWSMRNLDGTMWGLNKLDYDLALGIKVFNYEGHGKLKGFYNSATVLVALSHEFHRISHCRLATLLASILQPKTILKTKHINQYMWL